MKKILLISTRQFWPVTSGHETVLYYNSKGLHEVYGYEIYVFCFADNSTDRMRPLPPFIKDVRFCNIPSKVTALKNAISHTLLGKNRWPIQNCLYYSDDAIEELKACYSSVQPEVIFVDMMRLAEYGLALQEHTGKKILFMDDNLAKRYQRQLMVGQQGNALGYYGKNTNAFVNRLLDIKVLKNLVLKLEIKLLTAYEKSLCNKFDDYIYVSAIEANEFNLTHNSKKAVAVTMGADVEYYSSNCEYDPIPRTLSFLGNFSYGPNAASIEMIKKEIMPRLADDVVLHVIGKCPEELRKKIESPRVKVLGFVDDTRSAVKSTDVFVAPISFGSGVKTKIVEAMAMGMPIVTNDIGAEALNVVHGQELFICNTVDDIVAKITYLLDHPEERASMGAAAQQYATVNHSWKEVYKAFGAIGL